jgi:hypothetical protein
MPNQPKSWNDKATGKHRANLFHLPQVKPHKKPADEKKQTYDMIKEKTTHDAAFETYRR